MPDRVTTVVRCHAHRRSRTYCVEVDRGVPAALRCAARGGASGGASGAGGGGGPPPCACASALAPGDLGDLVARAVRHGWGRWLEEGAVVIEC